MVFQVCSFRSFNNTNLFPVILLTGWVLTSITILNRLIHRWLCILDIWKIFHFFYDQQGHAFWILAAVGYAFHTWAILVSIASMTFEYFHEIGYMHHHEAFCGLVLGRCPFTFNFEKLTKHNFSASRSNVLLNWRPDHYQALWSWLLFQVSSVLCSNHTHEQRNKRAVRKS